MYDDADMERAADMVGDVANDLAEGKVVPADIRFACMLLEEHYNAAADGEYGSTVACEFAWRAAQGLAELVGENPDFDWLNAYFVGSGLVNCFYEYGYDAGLPEGLDAPRHPEWHRTEDDAAADGTGRALDELSETAALHTDLDEPLEGKGTDRAGALAMTFHHLGTLYAHDLPDDMLESYASVEVMEIVTEFKDREDATNREVVDGGRILEEWLEHRCKREHAALCVTT